MRLLLDTHVLLWALAEPDKLPSAVRELLEDPANDHFFSAASIWEIAIKAQIGRVNFTVSPQEIAHAAQESGFQELAITSRHAAAVSELPLHHRDPFDRLLIAQALCEPARLVTVDSLLGRYSELVYAV